ncbi:23S rRNA methyltransferase attenuation leader peptide [Streptococcus suis]|nr:23S rRNA methyltransferase attenuation leader peptide [Enterococcus faecium]HAQ6741543.1 23S rRNA methyltransferase attenuation leader peptide [Enterococcus faecium]HAQ6742555.1 23S rRNA methyltransferase attenuation leader peptide [Enterococcus faecium]
MLVFQMRNVDKTSF